jgi:hypothetical protein
LQDNPVFVKKAHQLLADMSKEYSEFILALRSIVNAVDQEGERFYLLLKNKSQGLEMFWMVKIMDHLRTVNHHLKEKKVERKHHLKRVEIVMMSMN